ncbi:MAG TPA: DUF2339 domain-containing protein [Gaiellaceae bacterium]|jgi:hypothetical protein
MTDTVQAQLDQFARKLAALTAEFETLQREANRAPAPQQAPTLTPFPLPSTPTSAAPAPPPPVWRPEQPAPHTRRPQRTRPQFELDLLGPRALAVAGGIVTLLGIVFFFVLAVNRGWIGSTGRVALGAIASTLVFAGGLELKRRYGTTYATLAAVGAGIAGAYATLLSAAALYHMLSHTAALLVALGIAAVALATSIAWRSQILAGIGLLGAMLVPALIALQGGVSLLPTAFVAVVFAVLAGVSIWLDWRGLLIAGGLASVPQLLALAFAQEYEHTSPARVIALVSVFFVLYVATGVARQLRLGTTSLDGLATLYVLGGGLVAAGSFARLFATHEQQGVALLVLAVAYAAPGAVFFARERTRNLSALLTFGTFTLTAIGLALVLHGDALAYAWAAEAAGLAWLASTVREIRFQIWSLVYLGLALVHALVDAPPHHLTEAVAHPAAGVGTIVAVAAAAAVFSFYARPWPEHESDDADELPVLAGMIAGFAGAQRVLRAGAAWLALVLSTYALSLGVLAVFSSFSWATVTNAIVWMAIATALLAAGFLRDSQHLRVGALMWLTGTGLVAVGQAVHVLDGSPRSVVFVVVGSAGLVASVVYGLAKRVALAEALAVCATFAVAALALLVYSIAYGLDGRQQGATLLGLAAVYGILSAVLFRRPARDASTVFWAIAVVVGAVANVQLLDGTYIVLGWAVAGVALGWLARRAPEPRLCLGASALVGLAVLGAFAILAPPTHLFTTQLHPAHGTASIFIAALAVAGLAYFARSELGRLGALRTAPWWIAAGLTVYGLSILILELVEWISGASLHTEFQRGQTAVSAFWGLLALALLYAGLKRRWRPLRIAGLVFFPIILAKIFLYDLPSLSSVTRALSFLAVGAVLLLGGFFYQRLTASRTQSPSGSVGKSVG